MLIPPNQPIREGDTLLRFNNENFGEITFEDPISGKQLKTIVLTSMVSFGTVMKYSQGWMEYQIATSNPGNSSEHDLIKSVRLFYQCANLVPFNIALKRHVEKAMGSAFNRLSNTFTVRMGNLFDARCPKCMQLVVQRLVPVFIHYTYKNLVYGSISNALKPIKVD